MQPVANAAKHVTGDKREKTCKSWQARENMQPVASARKYATGGQRGKYAACGQRGKYAAGGKRETICNRWKARDNMQPVASAGKYAAGGKRGKICNQVRKNECGDKIARTCNWWPAPVKPVSFFGFASDGLRKEYICCNRMMSIPGGGGGGGNSNIKKVGVLVVSLRGVNFRFWSRLGC